VKTNQLLSVIILLIIISIVNPVQARETKLKINDEIVEERIVIIQGRSLIPARLIPHYFRAQLKWEAAAQNLKLKTENTTFNFLMGDRVIKVNSQIIPLSIPARLIDNQVHIPLRALVKIYGGKLSWQAESKTIIYQLPSQTNVRHQSAETRDASLPKQERKTKKIVIDPGHGGEDPGAIGFSGVKEKGINLQVARQLRDSLEKEGFTTLLTRSSDEFIPLTDRAKLANDWGADIFISIHANFNYKPRINGTATYAHWYSSDQNWALAWYIQEALLSQINLQDNGLKAANFVVLRETKMPAVLVETAFLSNPREEQLLTNVNFQARIVEGITQGVKKHFSEIKRGV
jgi:N-acetylmuramoyl-L-alanine amidase